MDKFRALSTLVIILLALWSTGCEILRTEQDAQGEISEFTPPEADESAPEEAAQTSAVVQLQPAMQQLNVGETTTVELRLSNVVNLFGAEVQLQFAPSVLQVQDADPNTDGVQISNGDLIAADFVLTNAVDNTSGLISYTVTQVAPAEPVSRDGLLASFVVEAIGIGDSTFTFSTIKLATADGQQIPTTLQSNQITVGQTGSPTTAPITPTVTVTTTTIATSTIPPTTPTVTPTVVITTTTLPPTETPAPIVTATPTATPLPPPPPTQSPLADLPPGATLGFCYRVQKGQSLGGIAQEFNTTPKMLQIINDLFPPGYIYPQKALFIPEELGSGPNFYVVREGDTLENIAAACNLPLNFLIWVNDTRLVNGGVVPDMVLEIPLPPFPPPSRYPYPPSGPFGPPSVYPPPGFGPPVSGRPPCAQPRCGGW